MAAKRKRKSQSSKPWIAVVVGLTIAAVAFAVLLSGQPLGGRNAERPKSVSAPEPSRQQYELDRDPDLARDLDHDHDRDHIDQASRDQLREILRAESEGK